MKVEVKNWVGIVVLLFLGFVLGRTIVIPDLNASPEYSDIGRYQLLIGEIETSWILPDWEPRISYPFKTLFRIDTMTGDISVYEANIPIPTDKDSLVKVVPMWQSLTSAYLLSPEMKWEDFLERSKEK